MAAEPPIAVEPPVEPPVETTKRPKRDVPPRVTFEDEHHNRDAHRLWDWRHPDQIRRPSALYQLTDKEFVCFTDELRCKLLSSHFKEVPVRRSSRVGCNLEECHGFKMSAKYRLCSEMKSYMLSLVPDDNEV